MAQLTADQIAKLAGIHTITGFRSFLSSTLGIVLTNQVVLTTIANEFNLGSITYEYAYDPPNNSEHYFFWDSTIDVPPEEEQDDPPSDEDLSLRNEFVAKVLIQVKDKAGEQQGIYGGLIQIPIGTGAEGTADGSSEFLEFKLCFQNKKSPGQAESSSIIVGSLSAQEDLQVCLEDLISKISPGLSDLIPVELLRYFRVGASIIVVIDCSANPPNPTVSASGAIRNKKRSMLFSIGFNGVVKFNQIPIISQVLPLDIYDSEFAFEFLVALQEFSRIQLIAINYFLKEIEVPLKIEPPCNSTNVLKRGAAIAAHFKIGFYVKGWLTPLSRTSSTTNPTSPSNPKKRQPSLPSSDEQSSSLVPTSNVEVLAASSSNSSSSDEELPIVITNNATWLTVQQSFATLHFEKVGLTYKNQEINLTPQFVLQVARMVIILNGLSIRSPLMDFEPSFALNGFGLQVTTSGLEIGGAFLLVEDTNYEEFIGTAVIGLKVGSRGKKCLSLSAIGGFAKFDDSDEFGMFLYLAINIPLGGPPFFFVTGISGGFGYNYRLIVPTVDELMTFPFVYEADSGKRAPNPVESAQILANELQLLSSYVIPEVGAWFGAAGIKFTCFKIIDGSGLLAIALDSSGFEIDFIAIVTLMIPTTFTGPFEPIAMAQMVMEARFAPAEGVLMVRGQLTPSSYVFSRECHLIGGYAYGLWFAGERAGDFVLTQGGYHPRFYAASRYPDVPRLGYSWQIDFFSYTTARVYFALCGYGVMVGGMFAIAYKAGPIWAEFDAGIDFLICWKPYHYDVSWHLFVRAGIGALAVGLGVDVRFWGPDFGCKFKIRIIVITVTIEIGDQTSQYPDPIEWAEFREAFLPPDEEVCSIAIVDGLSKQIIRGEGEDQEEIWVVNPRHLELTTDSIIPAKVAQTWGRRQLVHTEKGFGINSMGIKTDELKTVHNVTITKDGYEEGAHDKFTFEPITKYAPVAAWGNPISSEHIVPPEPNDEPFIEDVFFSFRIVPAKQPKPGVTEVIGIEHLLYDTDLIDKSYLWSTIAAFVPDASLTTEAEKRDRIKKTVKNNSRRDSLLTALGFDTNKVTIDPAISESFIFPPQISGEGYISEEPFGFTWCYEETDDEDEQCLVLMVCEPEDVPPLHIGISNTLTNENIAIKPINGLSEPDADNYHFKLAFASGILAEPNAIAVESPDWSVSYVADEYGYCVYLLWIGAETILSPQDTMEVILTGVAGDSSVTKTTTDLDISWQFAQGGVQVINQGTTPQANDYYENTTLRLEMAQSTKSNLPLYVGFVNCNKVLNINGETSSLQLRLTNTNLPIATNPDLTFKYSTNDELSSQLVVTLEVGTVVDVPWALGTQEQVSDITISIAGEEWSQIGEIQAIEVEGVTKALQWTLTPKSADVVLAAQETMLINLDKIVTSHSTGETNLYLSYQNIRGYKDGQFVCQIEKAPLTFDNKVRMGTRHELNELSESLLKVNDGISLDKSGTLNFGQGHYQKINLNDNNNSTTCAIGTQDYGVFFRTIGNFGWYKKGSFSSDELDAGEGGTVEMVLKDGRLGIATTDPSDKLDVNGSAHIGGSLNFGSTTRQMINLYREDFGIGVQSSTTYFRTNKNFGWYTGGSYIHDELSAGDEGRVDMVLKDGLLGIGTNNPSDTLDVNGSAKFHGRIKDETGYVIPVGTIAPYAGSSAPEGWLMCQGDEFDTDKYPDLYAVLGNSNTLPDLRNRFLVGVGDGYTLKDAGGADYVTLTVDHMPKHNHIPHDDNENFPYNLLLTTDATGQIKEGDTVNYYDHVSGQPNLVDANGIIQDAGGDQAFDNRPPYYAINYIIKA